IRYGLRTIATLVFLLSALAGGVFGFTAMLPYVAVLGVSVMAGFIVQGNFPISLRACSPLPPRVIWEQRSGSTPASALAPFLGTLLFGVTLDQFGGTSHLAAWAVSFATCG